MQHTSAIRNLRPVKPKSNSIGFWIGALVAVAAIFIGYCLDDGSQIILGRAGLVGFSFVPFSIAVAELRSGYAWKNLALGSRGVARAEEPRLIQPQKVRHSEVSVERLKRAVRR